MTDDRVFRLIYRSRSLLPAETRRSELGSLFTQARANNKQQSITGALMLNGDWFVQTLEGDELKVRSLFDHIEKDTRHDSVALLETGEVDGRAFPRWAMAEVNDAETGETYLIAHDDGIAPAASRGTTPRQQAVLDAMRGAARADAALGPVDPSG